MGPNWRRTLLRLRVAQISPIADPMYETIAKNPFIIGHPASGKHLADREREVETIANAFADASSRLVVYGDRRLGKTSAVRKAAEDARRTGTPVIVVDLAKVTSPVA